jgi:hypothetical protein
MGRAVIFTVGIIGRRVITLFFFSFVFQYVAAKILVQRWLRDNRLATNSPEMVTVLSSLYTALFYI